MIFAILLGVNTPWRFGRSRLHYERFAIQAYGGALWIVVLELCLSITDQWRLFT
jgi:hypothetical protein